jgi:predicted ATPase/class 3 adenylate cyclase
MVLQPSGTVTLVFTDVEGSTGLLERLGRERYAEALDLHRRLLREAFDVGGGFEVDCEGDAFFVAFASAEAAVAAAGAAQQALAAAHWPAGNELRVRMGVHTGEPLLVPPKYVGLDVHRAARIMAAGHGSQVVLSQTTRDLVGEAVAVRDLGEHRLKDLSAPQRLFQLLVESVRSEFPVLRSLENRPTNLPVQPTVLIGREKELRELEVLLGREEVRLVTLTGTGGTGKTRLALQAAAELVDDFAAGVFLVSLAAIRDPSLVVPTIAQTLGVREQAGEPLEQTLKAYVRGRRLLLVLDNFEQLAEAAPSVASLLAAAPDLKVMVTSRTPLRLSGERTYPVPPLGLPDLGRLPELSRLRQFDAVSLFVARAEAARPDFVVTSENAPAVAEICVRLDGLPLALELAAARVRVLPVGALLARLDQRLSLLTGGAQDLEVRQRTLRATIAWSYELLSAREQTLFARLGVFVGGCRIEAAEAVCDTDGELGGGEVLEGLVALVEQSLLRQTEDSDGEPRFSMLETIREYALERLEECADGRVLWRRHLEYFVLLAQEADADLRADRYGEWAYRLEAEHANLRLALDWAERSEEATLKLRLVSSLVRFWQVRGHIEEGSRWVEDALAHTQDTDARMRLLGAGGRFALELGDFAHSAELLEEQLELARAAGDNLQVADSLRLLGGAFAEQRQFEQARTMLKESLRLAHELEDARTLRAATNGLANLYWRMGDYDQSAAFGEAELALAREAGDRRWEGIALLSLAAARALLGDLANARQLLRNGLRVAREVGDQVGVQSTVEWLGIVAVGDSQPRRAAILLGASETLSREHQHFISPEHQERLEQAIAATRQALGSEFERTFAEGGSLPLNQAVAYALDEQPGASASN